MSGGMVRGPAKAVTVAIAQLLARDGCVSPKSLLSLASQADHPLHKHFTWNDQEAAENFRLLQANQMIRSVRVDGQLTTGEPVRVRALLPVGDGLYRPVSEVMCDATQRARALKRARSELEAFKAKYSHLEELGQIIERIEDL